MIMIEVDHEVAKKLEEISLQFGITRNGVLKKLLKLDKSNILQNTTHQKFKKIQEKLIPYIVKILYENGSKANKQFVEEKIFDMFQDEFLHPYYNELVSHGVPRWKHHIAWAKEKAKQNYGLIKSAEESGRGIWELTPKGISYYKNNFLMNR